MLSIRLTVDFGLRGIGRVPALAVPYVPADLNAKRVLVRRFPYSVFFHEAEAEIRIVAFAHAKRRPGYWMGR